MFSKFNFFIVWAIIVMVATFSVVSKAQQPIYKQQPTYGSDYNSQNKQTNGSNWYYIQETPQLNYQKQQTQKETKKKSNSGCPVYSSAVDVDVRVSAGGISVNNKRSVSDLQREDYSTTLKENSRSHYQVSGLTKGSISVERQIEFKTSVNQETGEGCIWPERITADVVLKSTVFIANKYKPGTCEYRETYNHEIKHVNVDRTVLNKYIPYLKSRIAMISNTLGVQGPMSSKRISSTKINMSRKIKNEIDQVINQLQEERRNQQNSVDTEEEYQRVSNACAGF